ncbi:MAG TPA: hypothetical protein VGN84_02060 [Solirubrobacterales bacterium]|jgi:hypothetical protein|nr:hypothetical protein [Solirubrobacterales bacterium]
MRKHRILGGLFAALMLCVAFAASAGAAPAWKFNGKALEGEETILGGAEKSGLTMWGFTTTCDNFLYEVNIWNKEGTGKGNITSLPLYNCYTNSTCTVEAIEAESFPWSASLSTVAGSNYLTVKNVNVWILYGGWFCPLWGVWANVTGTAGGLIDNTTETATFSSSSFKATGTKLEALGESVEWNGTFPTEAFKWHRGEPISVS